MNAAFKAASAAKLHNGVRQDGKQAARDCQGNTMLALLAIFAVVAALFTEFGLLLVRAYVETQDGGPAPLPRKDERQMNGTLRRVSARLS